MQYNPYETLQEKISGLTVTSLDSEAVAVESLWENRRLVLVFLRHFG